MALQLQSDPEIIACGEGKTKCRYCGKVKQKVKRRREDGKGWRSWERCEACLKEWSESDFECNTVGALKAKPGGRWRRIVNGDELNAILEKYGSVSDYNKARKELEKTMPLLVTTEFKSCPKCSRALSLYREVRHDRGGAIRNRWRCSHCYREQIRDCQIKNGKVLTEKGKTMSIQKGWDEKRKRRASSRRALLKSYVEDKGWSRLLLRKRGLTKERYLALLSDQGGKCAIPGCNFVHRPEVFAEKVEKLYGESAAELKDKTRSLIAKLRTEHLLYVDHDHGRGDMAVRALLCSECNLALGHIEKLNARNISAMAFDAYLYTHGEPKA